MSEIMNEIPEVKIDEKTIAILKIASDEYAAIKQIAAMDEAVDKFTAMLKTVGFNAVVTSKHYPNGDADISASTSEKTKWETCINVNSKNVIVMNVKCEFSIVGWLIPTDKAGNPRLHVTSYHDEQVILKTLAKILNSEMIECTFDNRDDEIDHEHYAIIKNSPLFRVVLHNKKRREDD